MIKIVAIIIRSMWSVRLFGIICEIFAAMPLRDFPREYKTIKLKPRKIVFVAPTKTRNAFFDNFINEAPSVAACPLPIAGKILHNGENSRAAIIGFLRFFSFTFGFSIICGGILVFVFMLIIREEIPNNPESIGSRGSLTLELRTAIPRKPERRKTIIAGSFLFSCNIKNSDEKINRNGIVIFIIFSIFGRMRRKMGETRIMIIIAMKLPKVERYIA